MARRGLPGVAGPLGRARAAGVLLPGRHRPGEGRGFNPDAWDGYAASRDRVVDPWLAAASRNVVVLTGDVHANWAADIKRRFDDPEAPVVGTELVSTSITSGGDGSDTQENTADLRVLPYLQEPGAPVSA